MSKKNLPVKKVVVSDPTEDDIAVNFVAMVDQPAIEIGWMAFNKENMVKPHDGESESEYMKRCVPVYINEGKEQDQAVAICLNEYQSRNKMNQAFKFQIQDEERRIITGALMIADLEIFRRDPKTGEEYYIVFDAPTIEKIVKKFAKAGYHNNVNLMHIPELKQEHIYQFESFITDSKRGIKAPAMFGEIPEGSWFASYYVESDKAWDFIKSGKLTGFSVEGYFNTVEEFSNQKKTIDFDELASRFIADF